MHREKGRPQRQFVSFNWNVINFTNILMNILISVRFRIKLFYIHSSFTEAILKSVIYSVQTFNFPSHKLLNVSLHSVLFDFNPAHPDQLLIFEDFSNKKGKCCKRRRQWSKSILESLKEILNQRMIIGSEVPPLSYQLRVCYRWRKNC